MQAPKTKSSGKFMKNLFALAKPKGTSEDGPPDVPLNILAFRTITTILAQIPRSSPIDVIDNLETVIMDPAHRQEVRILDAFAHLAVGEHDVAALATNRAFSDDTQLRVMTCINHLSINTNVNISTQPVDLIAKVKAWYIMLTRNNLRDEPETSSTPTIISSSEPEDLGGRSAHDYIQGLEKHWIKPSLPTHLWILSNVLISEDCLPETRNTIFTDLSRYTAAMSYKKIARRFNNQTLSRPYIEALEHVKAKDIPLVTQSMREPGGTRKEKAEVESDRCFLEDVVVKRFMKNPTTLDTPIPNIIKMAESMLPNNMDLELYTNETSTEFHSVLLELLTRFKNALDTLVNLDCNKTVESSNASIEKFNKNIDELHQNGYALLRISRGRAFQTHIENIKEPLVKYRLSNPGGATVDHDEELHSIRQGTLLKSYVAWLRLVVSHFDAVEILLRYVFSLNRFPYKSISLSILVAPPTNSALLPWPKLFTNGILPTTGSKVVMGIVKSNEQIHTFLSEGITAAIAAKHDRIIAQNACDACKDMDTRLNIQAFQRLTLSPNKTVSESATIIYNKVTQLKTNPASLVEIVNEIQALRDELGEASDRERFFLNLDNPVFKGTLHCEACLASVLPAFTQTINVNDSKYKGIDILPKMQDFGRVIGVSKRCCPTCTAFLQTLAPNSEETFIVRGNHGTISACSLPPWTPTHIVDQMVESFGRMLREDLLAILNEDTKKMRFRNRCKSTGSDTLSLDSSEGLGVGPLRTLQKDE